MISSLKKRISYFIDLTQVISEKEIKTRYKRTIFGVLWFLLNPLLLSGTIGLIFQFVIKVQMPNFFLFLFIGLLPWNYFSQTVSKCTAHIVNERQLVQKGNFPKEALIFSIIFSNGVHYLFSLGILTALAVFFVGNYFYTLFILVISIVLLLLCTISFSLIASALNVRYRDIAFFMQAILGVLFYCTPIMYDYWMLPARLQMILQFNPMLCVILLFQHAFLGTKIDFFQILINYLVISSIAVASYFFFRKESKNFADWL